MRNNSQNGNRPNPNSKHQLYQYVAPKPQSPFPGPLSSVIRPPSSTVCLLRLGVFVYPVGSENRTGARDYFIICGRPTGWTQMQSGDENGTLNPVEDPAGRGTLNPPKADKP